MNVPSWGRMLTRYVPAFMLAAALALIAVVIPSRPAREVATGGASDILTPAGLGSGAGSPTETPAAPGTDANSHGLPAATATSTPGVGGTGSTRRTAGNAGSVSGAGAEQGAPQTAGGVAGTAAVSDCSRNNVLRGVTCRPPRWTGLNGGATDRGVTGDTVNIVFYQPMQNQQVDTALSTAGIPTREDRTEVLAAWEKYLNSVFETYNRRVKLVLHYGASGPADAAGQQADAIKVADELKAFAVMSHTAGPAFWTELRRKGIPGFSNTQYESELYEQLAPHHLGFLPDVDITNKHVAEYYCKRLNGRKASFAGSPVYQQQTRKLGVIFLDNGRNGLGDRLSQELHRTCGIKPALLQGYSPDVSTSSQQSTTIVAAMRDAGITTVTCLCDPIFPAYFTKAATSQGWLPEWIHNGLFGTDLVLFSRLYDQQQWSHSFGVSAGEFPIVSADDPAWRAYRAGSPQGRNPKAKAVGYFYFWALRPIVESIEAAGPTLTDESFLRALYALPPLQFANSPRLSFGRNGPSAYTATDDLTEVWWNPTREGPDGKPGTFFYVGGGKRYQPGQWPDSDAFVFRDDGSPQPARDPDAN